MATVECIEGFEPCRACNVYDVTGVEPEPGYQLVAPGYAPNAPDSIVNPGYKKIPCNECTPDHPGCVIVGTYDGLPPIT